jgi:Zn-dependent protease with chaperone function
LRQFRSTLLIVVFYVGALPVALSPLVVLPALAFVPWEVDLMLLSLVAGSLLVGPIILWAIIPRKSTPDLDGIVINPALEGRLIRFVRSVAKRTRQAMPSLVMVNTAAHASTGFYAGFAGFGSQRVLSVGLPYFAVMSVNELSALLAHEMGHFFRGSMFHWAWIVETQHAINRFFQKLERHWPRLIPAFSFILEPFVKACFEVSRQQELAADRFAAEHFGAGTLRGAIEKTRQLELDYGLYFQTEILPAIHAGYAPPLLAGFADFREGLQLGLVPRFQLAVKTDPAPVPAGGPAMGPEFLTHPDFETRIDAIRSDGWRQRADDDRPAADLIEDLAALELRLLNWEAQKRGLGTLRALKWQDVGERVYLPQWREFARRHSDVLNGSTLRDLPRLVREAEEMGARLLRTSNYLPAREQCIDHALQFLSAASCAALDAEGWRLDYTSAGHARAFSKNGRRVDPFEVIEKLAYEEMAGFEWEDTAEELGVGGVQLAAISASHAG